MDPRLCGDDEFMGKWAELRELRTKVMEAIEPERREKRLGSGLEAAVVARSEELLAFSWDQLAELFIVSSVKVEQGNVVTVTRTTEHKCGRCWRHLPEVGEDGDLCNRCDKAVGQMA